MVRKRQSARTDRYRAGSVTDARPAGRHPSKLARSNVGNFDIHHCDRTVNGLPASHMTGRMHP
jgi:hypothetical protein